MVVSWGVFKPEKIELLKDTIDKSSGMDKPSWRHTYCTMTAKISSLTTTAVGGSGNCKSS